MKLKICIVAVCYNAHEDAKCLLDSIATAFDKVKGLVDLSVVLSDNSTLEPPDYLISAEFSFDYRFLKNSNIGYFPAFLTGVKSLSCDVTQFDFVAVSNVDLQVDPTFFENLCGLKIDQNVGVIAPAIFSLTDGRDLNPKMRLRPSVKKVKFARALFVYRSLFIFYNKLLRVREYIESKKQSLKGSSELAQNQARSAEMYGAHGSFMIFSKYYFAANASIDYPRFLFGEEGFVAEQARAHSLKIVHFPNLIIHDREHGTTSQQPSAFICQEHVKSYDYYLHNFRKEEL